MRLRTSSAGPRGGSKRVQESPGGLIQIIMRDLNINVGIFVSLPSRSMDISLPSTSASMLRSVDKSGTGGVYRTPNVETLDRDHAAGGEILVFVEKMDLFA